MEKNKMGLDRDLNHQLENYNTSLVNNGVSVKLGRSISLTFP